MPEPLWRIALAAREAAQIAAADAAFFLAQTHRTVGGRWCPGCGVSLDHRRRQTTACGNRCKKRVRRPEARVTHA